MTYQFRTYVTIITLLATTTLGVKGSYAASDSGQVIIRDTEIEKDVRNWTGGVMNAAGMQSSQVNIILIQSPDVNAFVAGGANIFIYTGLIDLSDNVGQVVGVIAHELGHIAGGHLSRTADVSKNASFEAMLGAIVGIGAAIATGDSSAAAAGISIGQSQAMNNFLAFSRVQESSADQAGFRFLTGAGLSPQGLPTFLEKLESQELLPASQQSPFVRTHPLSRDRVEALQHKVDDSPLKTKAFPSDWDNQYARVKAKLLGFTSPLQVTYKYPTSDMSIPAQYARAISSYRLNQMAPALQKTEALIKLEPKNPYFYELKGQILYEFGKAALSVDPYEKAVLYAPDSGLIRTALAQSLIESAGQNTTKLQSAIDHLKRAEKDEPRSTQIKRLLATAFGRMGKEPEARVYLAEEALMRGNKKDAVRMADVTLKQLPPNSPEALRAQDIINTVGEPTKNK
jgi:predicted Zn-dependent protease